MDTLKKLASDLYEQQTTVHEYANAETYANELLIVAHDGGALDGLGGQDRAQLKRILVTMAQADLDTAKRLMVYGKNIPPRAVTLNGVATSERLTPKMARRAIRAANVNPYTGGTVWDPHADYGYRVYERSARKLSICPATLGYLDR